MPQSVMMLKSFNSERVCTGRMEGSDVATTPIKQQGEQNIFKKILTPTRVLN